jgi:hypothetical protein
MYVAAALKTQERTSLPTLTWSSSECHDSVVNSAPNRVGALPYLS